MTIIGNFIGGKTTFSASNETIPVYDPATGKVVRELTQSTADEVARRLVSRMTLLPPGRKPRRCVAPAFCSTSKP